ncbi:uncharacterized protein LOC115633761 [Scaptodrosophila lebanonensis]|uniref:Uncharacterized protein LOC115633761 n=1 Tax=Drosophila lebanonensis TaxID=7225 RepID=A0A6J2UF55_DROLE|nr:uncharacterized protein LOC115633761 [Scaptodrosophila lebanonensis]
MELRFSASLVPSPSPPPHASFTNTAKLPIETVKRLIAAVSRRPVLWLRNNCGGGGAAQRRSDITPIWNEVGQDVNLPADICRIKWGHLRDNFRKVFIRNNLSQETPSSWRFYNDMRFMERAVSENIMRQTRKTAGGKRGNAPNYWLDSNSSPALEKCESNEVNVPICELNESYDAELHRPSFSDISAFFEDSQTSPQNKRIKLEPRSAADSDDDFDEDAASDNEDERNAKHTETVSTPDAGVFTIEVLDDEDELANPLPKLEEPKSNDVSHINLPAQPTNLPFKYISTDASTNTEGNFGQEDDADRLFLLSLMPFLQKVDERRKLRVRQKLQNVLVEELEFG